MGLRRFVLLDINGLKLPNVTVFVTKPYRLVISARKVGLIYSPVMMINEILILFICL